MEFPVTPAVQFLPQSLTYHFYSPLSTRMRSECRRGKGSDVIGRGLCHFRRKYCKERKKLNLSRTCQSKAGRMRVYSSEEKGRGLGYNEQRQGYRPSVRSRGLETTLCTEDPPCSLSAEHLKEWQEGGLCLPPHFHCSSTSTLIKHSVQWDS